MTERRAVICILGMHRSGTSCLTGSLQEAGLYLGDVITQAPYNAKGNRENRDIMTLQEQILRANGGSWESPPNKVIWHAEHCAQRDAIIARYPPDRVWGFKDPRTLLTLPGWLEVLSGVGFVGTFRHPAAVAASLTARNGFSKEKGLALWLSYNSRLLHYQRQFGFDLIAFDATPERYLQRLTHIAAKLGLSAPAEFSFFERSLKKQTTPTDETLPSAVASVYRTLQQLAA